jgi:regulation of enolase protein 1 (concanavalin A-like superfamily)
MTISIPSIESPFRPFPDDHWSVDATSGSISVSSIPGTDIFTDPGGDDGGQVTSSTLHNAATLLTDAPAGDFQLSALVRVRFAGTFDAGVLFLRHDLETWAKLCFEFSPRGEGMIVSVVNSRVSDDANAFTVDGDHAHLRVSRKGKVFAFHVSVDGERWMLIRAFSLPNGDKPLEIGFEAQSPQSDGCDVVFEEPRLVERTIADFRDES